METKNILNEFLANERIFISKKKRLIVLLGSFADFDSFEYAQKLSSESQKLAMHSVELILIGIGSEKSKEYFCRFNKIDPQKVFAMSNAGLHQKLNLKPNLCTKN